MFKAALVVSTAIHVGGLGLFWIGVDIPFKNGLGDFGDRIVVFEIGWIEPCSVIPSETRNLVVKDEVLRFAQDDTSCQIASSAATRPPRNDRHCGSSGTAKKNLGGAQDEYLLEVRRRIEQFKFYPREARRRFITGDVTVGFYINCNGNPEVISIIKSSGYSILDTAARETISRASPFPKPADKKYVQTTIVFTLYSDNLP